MIDECSQGGRFEAAEKRLSGNTEALRILCEEMKAQRQNSEDSHNKLTAAFMAHALDDKDYQLKFVTMMDSLERRLSDVAVRVGVPKWSEVAPSAS